MKRTDFLLTAADGLNLSACKWTLDKPENSKGVVQLVHGMAEHIARYQDFAAALTAAGYLVYGLDLRGHGKTAGTVERIGYFADKDGWRRVVDDVHLLTVKIKEENDSLPVFLFGHSMGSFLARHYASLYGKELTGLILSGTAGDPGFMGLGGLLIARIEMMRRGKKGRSKLMDDLSFGSYNRPFQPARTPFDWLSRDQREVDKYIADPYCGGIFTAGFFYDLLGGLREIHRQENIVGIPENLPVFFISGEEDPVGNMTKGVRGVIKSYQEAGLKDVKYKFYSGARHELIHEINLDEVIRDVLNWIESH